MDTDAAQKLMIYINEYFIEPHHRFPTKLFEEMSYSRWAAFEIVNALLDHPTDPPVEVVENFLLKMALYAQVSESEDKRRIFSIAEDAAEDILCIFS